MSVKSNGACDRWKSGWKVLVSERLECRGDHRPRRGDRCRGVEQHSRPVSRWRQSVGDEAAKIGSEAAKLGNNALRRLSKEVEHRPLVTLAVAVGVGILVGLVSHRR